MLIYCLVINFSFLKLWMNNEQKIEECDATNASCLFISWYNTNFIFCIAKNLVIILFFNLLT